MTRHARRWGHVIAASLIAVAVLAIVAAWALATVDKHQQGTAVAIVIPAAVVIFGALVWLGKQGGNGGTP